jgi:hypothetical protein
MDNDITLTLPKNFVKTVIDALEALGEKELAGVIALQALEQMQAAGQLQKGK